MINHVALQGRLVADPEFNATNSGVDCANFRLAWSEKYKDTENKLFLECKTFGSTAKFMQNYMNRKGQEIAVEGKLNTEEWKNKEGQNRSKIVLVVSSVHFCGKRDDNAGTSASTNAPAPIEVGEDQLPF